MQFFNPLVTVLISFAIFASELSAQNMAIWPSQICAVKAHPDSTITGEEGQAVHVKTGVGYTWPGATIYFKEKSCDLSGYTTIALSLSNSCDRTLNILLSVKNRPDKGSSPGGNIALAPQKCGVMEVNIFKTPWVLDQPLELVGMRGYPEALDTAQFDLGKVAELHVFLANPDKPASFSILNIAAKQRGLPPKPLNATTFLPFVDRFGQFKHDDWPGKIHSEEQLYAARAAEAEYLDKTKPPKGFNGWGGWADGPKLQASGHFRTEKVEGKWWLVDPDGQLFFSHGVDCVNPGSATGIQYREKYFEWLPQEGSPYAEFYGWQNWAPHGFYKDKGRVKNYNLQLANMARKYGDGWHDIYKNMAHARIHAWGLNTIANWSDKDVYLMQRTPYVVSLGTQAPPIEGSDGWWGKFSDPFHPDFGHSLEKRVGASKETVNDPWCIGYFVDNELSWGNSDTALAEGAIKSPATQPAKIAICNELKKMYNEITKLNQGWKTEFKSWDDFLAQQQIPESPVAKIDLVKLHELIAARYFSVIKDVLQTGAPKKLYLGCRFASGSPATYRVASRYCDVVSFNNYKHTAEKDLPDGSDDKPLINGEFHFGALDRGLFHTGLVPVKDQEERAQAYKKFVISCLQHPRYVGTHWFQWRDQPLTGRGDGENYQIGFLTETDQPYPELIKAAREIGEKMYQIRMGESR